MLTPEELELVLLRLDVGYRVGIITPHAAATAKTWNAIREELAMPFGQLLMQLAVGYGMQSFIGGTFDYLYVPTHLTDSWRVLLGSCVHAGDPGQIIYTESLTGRRHGG